MKKDILLAEKARVNSYSPYSGYKVGALLRCKNGNTYTGCNVENNGIQSICAERTAFVKALSEGERDFESITIVADNISTPCGYCRQFMSEFVDKDFKIITSDGKKYTMEELLPYGFKIKL